VDDHEAEHLRRENRELRRSRARWRGLALVACGVVVALAVAGGVAGVMLGKTWGDRQREEAERRAAYAEIMAEEEREFATFRGRAERWERELEEERRQAALGPVAGGLGLAALDPDGGE
jgi:hypothetical protein